jgi:hypothetical protein
MKVSLPKYIIFNIVRVWIKVTGSKLDYFNVLVVPTMRFGIGMTYVLRPIALTTVFEIGAQLY